MQFWEVIGLGLVQGITEFLPVSSSGHLLAARLLFGWSDEAGVELDAFLHLGTLLAVLIYFWPVWWGIAKSLITNNKEAKDKRELLAKLLVATLPGAILGWYMKDWLGSLRSPDGLTMALLGTGLVLWLADISPAPSRRFAETSNLDKDSSRASWRDAILIGWAQVLALIPGVSRSGVTMAAGRARGLSRAQAAKFSFLMSAPIIAGAGLNGWTNLTHEMPSLFLLAGFATAFVSGLLAILGLLKLVEKMSFKPFVIYLLGLALVVWWFG